MGFQKTVLIVALVVLSITIIILSSFLANQEKNKEWPPEIATCPPYFDISQNGTMCIQTSGLTVGAKASTQTLKDASPTPPTTCDTFYIKHGDKIMTFKEKCDWSKACNVSWDGVCL
jgi:hypothetical protein